MSLALEQGAVATAKNVFSPEKSCFLTENLAFFHAELILIIMVSSWGGGAVTGAGLRQAL